MHTQKLHSKASAGRASQSSLDGWRKALKAALSSRAVAKLNEGIALKAGEKKERPKVSLKGEKVE